MIHFNGPQIDFIYHTNLRLLYISLFYVGHLVCLKNAPTLVVCIFQGRRYHLFTISDTSVFKNKLKTYLFKLAFTIQ